MLKIFKRNKAGTVRLETMNETIEDDGEKNENASLADIKIVEPTQAENMWPTSPITEFQKPLLPETKAIVQKPVQKPVQQKEVKESLPVVAETGCQKMVADAKKFVEPITITITPTLISKKLYEVAMSELGVEEEDLINNLIETIDIETIKKALYIALEDHYDDSNDGG